MASTKGHVTDKVIKSKPTAEEEAESERKAAEIKRRMALAQKQNSRTKAKKK